MEMLKSTRTLEKSHRCEECNINFSKYQNYVAHKKYYCSASLSGDSPQPEKQGRVDTSSDEETNKKSGSKEEKQTPSHSPISPVLSPHSAHFVCDGLNSNPSVIYKLLKRDTVPAFDK